MEKMFTQMLRQSLQDAHETFEKTMDGVTTEVAHFQPPGKALPIGAAYAHTVVSEDILLQNWVRKEKSLLESGWETKMGLSEPHPAMDSNWETNYTAWVKNVTVDLDKLRAYGQAVYKQTDDFMATLNDQDLIDMKVDLSAMGEGEWPLGRFIIRYLLSHVDSLCGEISAVKGIQGLKGYPF